MARSYRGKVKARTFQNRLFNETINSQVITVRDYDHQGKILLAYGTAAASTQDAQNRYAKGAVYIKTDASTGVASRYENIGTAASSSFDLIGAVSAGEISLAEGSILQGNASGAAEALDMSADGALAIGDGTNVGAAVMSGDATLANDGTLTIASNAIITSKINANAVNASKVANSDGTGGQYIQEYVLAVYDFAVDGGSQGTIVLADSGTFVDNSVVTLESVDVITTFTSSTDAATIKVGAVTDGDLSTAIAISDAGNPWDAGAHLGTEYTPTPLKTTGSRTVNLTIATEDLTAGKAVFKFGYWVSQ